MISKKKQYDDWPARPIKAIPNKYTIIILLLYLLIKLGNEAGFYIKKKLRTLRHVIYVKTALGLEALWCLSTSTRQLYRKLLKGIKILVKSTQYDINRQFLPKELYEPIELSPGKPIVSIIIPCYNYGKFIQDAVNSAINQTLSDLEIIVVDGGSSEQNTLDIISDLNNNNIKVFFREGRHLVGDNRNYGIERSSGRYICCLDADDTISPTYLEKAVFILENYAYDCVSTSVQFFGAKSGCYGVIEYPNLDSLIEGNHVTTCAVFRKALWNEIGGYRDTGIGDEHLPEDWDFWIRIAAHGARFRNLCREPLFNYRQHVQGSLSTTNVKTLSEQRAGIINANICVLTDSHKELSYRQSSRNLVSLRPGGSLTQAMGASNKKDQSCLFIWLPWLVIGGAERLLSTYAQHLSSKGWRIVVITTQSEPEGSARSNHWFTLFSNEIYQLDKTFPKSEWNDYVDYLLDSRCPCLMILAGSAYAYQRLSHIKNRIPSVQVIDFIFNEVGHTSMNFQFKPFIDKVACENESVADWLVRNNRWHKNDISIIESSVDTESVVPLPKNLELLERLGISSNALIVGYSGRMSAEKGPDCLLKIAKYCRSFPDIHFIMTGSGPLASSIKHSISIQDLRNVTFLGHVPDISTVMKCYDVLALPSRIDGRPMIVLEALSMGIPVVASRVGGLPEIIDHGINGFLCENSDYFAFAQHLISLARDPEYLQSLRSNSRLYALENFSIDQSVNKLMRICNFEHHGHDAHMC